MSCLASPLSSVCPIPLLHDGSHAVSLGVCVMAASTQRVRHVLGGVFPDCPPLRRGTPADRTEAQALHQALIEGDEPIGHAGPSAAPCLWIALDLQGMKRTIVPHTVQ